MNFNITNMESWLLNIFKTIPYFPRRYSFELNGMNVYIYIWTGLHWNPGGGGGDGAGL